LTDPDDAVGYWLSRPVEDTSASEEVQRVLEVVVAAAGLSLGLFVNRAALAAGQLTRNRQRRDTKMLGGVFDSLLGVVT
jgi:hypothetical protein